MPNAMIVAILLAAGQATRFGRCKQLTPIGGQPLLGHVLGTLRRSRIDAIVVVLGAYADEIREQVDLAGVQVVLNPDFAEGMSSSIQAGLRALPAAAEAAMIVLADQPLVTTATLDTLIAAYRRAGGQVTLPTYHGLRGNPVIVDRALFPEVMELRGDTGCRALFGDHADSLVKVPVDDRGVVTDVDRPEDLAGNIAG
jgi:molybdenum cofactor cytidylyltransferase